MNLDNRKFDYDLSKPVQPKEFSAGDYAMDMLAAPVRGLESLAHSAYNLGDFLAFDALPDWDEQRIFGKSATTPGMLIEGITQFAVPFGAIGVGVKAAGAAARAGKLTGVTGKVAKALTKGDKKLSFKGDIAVGAAADFIAFDAQEQKLSNLIQQYPDLQNPISEYLAADPDDSEVIGRAKNAIEGAILGGGIGIVGKVTAPLFKSLMAGIDAIKTRNVELEKGATREDATTTALLQHQDATKELDYAEAPDYSFIDDEVRLLREIETDKAAIADEEMRLKEILDKEAKGETVDEWQKELRESRVEKFKNDLVSNEEALEKLKARKSFEEQPDLQQKLEEFDVDIEELDEVIATRPPPFKNYEDAGMLDIIPRGAEDMIGRLMNKQPTGGASVSDVEDIQQFIKVMGFRMFEDVAQPMITNKIPSAGRYEFGSNLLKIRADVVKNGGLKRTMVHELWHSLSRYLPEEDLTKITKQFQRERNKYIQSFGIDIKDLEAEFDPSTVTKKDIPKELERFLRGKRGDFTNDNYRFKDIDEYFAEEMTDSWFKKEAAGELAPSGTPKRIAQELAIFLKDLFESLKAKLGIDQRQKIFNDFLKQRNVKVQRQMSLRPGEVSFAEMPTFKPDDVIDNLIENVDFSTFKVGGKQSLTGMLKTMGKLPEGMNMGDLVALEEKLVERFIQEAKLSPKLTEEVLDFGVVNEMADAIGADGKFFEGIVSAAKKDKTQLFRIASRMKVMESMLTANGTEIVRIAKEYKTGRTKLGQDDLEILEARLKGLLEQQLVIQSNHSSIASGFGRGLKARQMGVKMGLSPNELSNVKLRQEYLQKKGGMTVDNIVENILLAEAGSGDDMWNTVIALNKTVRGVEGGKMMNMVEEYYKNSIMSGPSTLTINFAGGGISMGVKNFERYVGGWFSGDPQARQAIINSWAQATKIKDLVTLMLNAWKSGDQFIGESSAAFVEQSAGSLGSITGKNIEGSLNRARKFVGKDPTQLEDATKGFIDFFGNLIRFPNRFNATVDQMYKFTEFRMRAHAQLWKKALDKGYKEPTDIAKYIDDSLKVLLTRSNRTFSQANLIREAEESIALPGATPAERSKAVHDYVQNAENEAAQKARELGLVQGEEVQENFKALEHLARDWVDPNISSAEDLTFSKQLGPKMQKVQDVVSSVPFGFIVAPFIRTPTNILKFSFARTLAPAAAAKDVAMMALSPIYKKKIEMLRKGEPGLEEARKTLLEQMNAVMADGSPDVITRAEARGRLATGTMLNAGLASVVYFHKDIINGGGPKDYKQRQAWQAAGNMPYSIKIGDKWISYQRLDPVATMIGVYADMADLLEDGKMHSIDATDFEKIQAAMTLTLTRNATNKSYLAGIDRFFKLIFDPDSTSSGKIFGSTIGGFVPNILSKGQSITGDQEIKEIRDMGDAVAKRFPGTTLDLKRNPLGEPVVQEYFEGVAGIVNPLNPIIWGSKKNDPVLLELAEVGHGFSSPSTKLDGLIDLTDFEGSNKRSAYDRWLELQGTVKINNRTLRQTLLKLIKSKQYQALDTASFSGLPSPRVEYLSRVLSRYRSRAKMEMLQEFPEIRQLQRQLKSAKRTGRQQDVLELLQ